MISVEYEKNEKIFYFINNHYPIIFLNLFTKIVANFS
jgi:hypothetical protein